MGVWNSAARPTKSRRSAVHDQPICIRRSRRRRRHLRRRWWRWCRHRRWRGRGSGSAMKASAGEELPRYRLRVSHRGIVEIDTTISEIHTRVIALIAVAGGQHSRNHPQHLPYIMGTIARTVEEALQSNVAAHSKWVTLCDNYEEPLQVNLEVGASSTCSEVIDPFSGGIGGSGGLFGAGGGGGGFGLFEGGAGGPGAPGAGYLFQIADDDTGVDINALVTPGTSEVRIWPSTQRIEVLAVGGGGGGGAGRSLIDVADLRLSG